MPSEPNSCDNNFSFIVGYNIEWIRLANVAGIRIDDGSCWEILWFIVVHIESDESSLEKVIFTNFLPKIQWRKMTLLALINKAGLITDMAILHGKSTILAQKIWTRKALFKLHRPNHHHHHHERRPSFSSNFIIFVRHTQQGATRQWQSWRTTFKMVTGQWEFLGDGRRMSFKNTKDVIKGAFKFTLLYKSWPKVDWEKQH